MQEQAWVAMKKFLSGEVADLRKRRCVTQADRLRQRGRGLPPRHSFDSRAPTTASGANRQGLFLRTHFSPRRTCTCGSSSYRPVRDWPGRAAVLPLRGPSRRPQGGKMWEKCRDQACAGRLLADLHRGRQTTGRLETQKLSKLGAVRPMMMA
jgi:hypothetical protein